MKSLREVMDGTDWSEWSATPRCVQKVASGGDVCDNVSGGVVRREVHMDETRRCPRGCKNMAPPYCHCTNCGETGVLLDARGYCSNCAEDGDETCGGSGWLNDFDEHMKGRRCPGCAQCMDEKKTPTTAELFARVAKGLRQWSGRILADDDAEAMLADIALLERRVGAMERALANTHRCGAQLCTKCDDAVSAILEVDAPPVFTLEEVKAGVARQGIGEEAEAAVLAYLAALRGGR